ncbi:MAG: hypothetical protein AAGC54_11345 [Cyanobacteria bacterium P01_F01_bin.4]
MSQDNGVTLKAFLIAFGIIAAFFLGLVWWSRDGFSNNNKNKGQQNTQLSADLP